MQVAKSAVAALGQAHALADLGQVCGSALAVTSGDALMSLADAERETGIALATLHARVKAGTLRSVTVWDRARGRPRQMLYRDDLPLSTRRRSAGRRPGP